MSNPTLAQQANAVYQRLWAAYVAGQLDWPLEDLGILNTAISELNKLEQQQ
jgi:hypothetical protein